MSTGTFRSSLCRQFTVSTPRASGGWIVPSVVSILAVVASQPCAGETCAGLFSQPSSYVIDGIAGGNVNPHGMASGNILGRALQDVGFRDIVIASTNDSIFVLFNRGDGTFDGGKQFLYTMLCDEPRAVATYDFDGDGDDDVIVGCSDEDSGDPSIMLLESLGDARDFAAPRFHPSGLNSAGAVRSIVVANLDGNNSIDIAAGTETGSVIQWFGSGGFSVGAALSIDTLTSGTSFIAAGQLRSANNDNEMYIVDSGGAFFRSGPPAAQPQCVVAGDGAPPCATAFGAGAGIAVTDLNGDGDPEIIHSDASSITVMDGATGFPSPTFPNGGIHQEFSMAPFISSFGRFKDFVVTADFDRDGSPDVALPYRTIQPNDSGGVVVLFNNGSGIVDPAASGRRVFLFPVLDEPRSILAADLNNDGEPDVVVDTEKTVGNDSLAYVWLNIPFSDGNGNSIHDDCEFFRGDVNGDLAVDISDPNDLLDRLFGPEPIECDEAADTNNDTVVDISDPIHLLNHLFGSASLDQPRIVLQGFCVWQLQWDDNVLLPGCNYIPCP